MRNVWGMTTAAVIGGVVVTIGGSFDARADPAAAKPDAPAPPPDADENEKEIEVVVEGEKAASEAASQVTYTKRELDLRPRQRAADVLEAVPGLFAVQHAGGGKANQYFLRGFDADHGTDVAFFVDGVPVNMVSHGHGQGYADMHFVIPEVVASLDASKGPYYARFGDFATAGAVELHLADKLDESFAQYAIGQYGVMRGLVVESPDLGESWRAIAAAEVYKDDGPFVNPEGLGRYSVYLRVTHDLGQASKLSFTWMSYGSSWNGSGQIPARAVCGEGEAGARAPESFGQPCLDHFGAVDPTEGGATQRHELALAYDAAWEGTQLSALAYLVRYRFDLYSNFTFFERDPVLGDEIEQDDDRLLGGATVTLKRLARMGRSTFTTTFGAEVRVDGIDNALFHDAARERLEARTNSTISESEIGVWIEEDARLLRWLRFVLGVRGERVDAAVDDHLEDTATIGTRSSGARGAGLVLPKLMAIVSPIPELDLFGDAGRGFHSNDARGAVLGANAATLLTPAFGAELGARARPFRNLVVQAAAFILDLQSELVWSGDEGTTETSGSTRRLGIEVGGRYHFRDWLFADIDATFTKARYVGNAGNGGAVALAPTRTLSAGVGARHALGVFTPYGSVRIKSIADRPATEGGSLVAEGFTIVDADAGVRWKVLELGVDAQNLFDSAWREAQFASTSRLPYEPAPVTGIHYSPGWPRTIVGRASLYW